MAILVDDLGLLFIMAPHTGCTAIGDVLRNRFQGRFVPEEDILKADGTIDIPRKHTQLSQLLESGLITADQRRGLVVAAGVRNPFDEQVSHYTHRERPHKARRDNPEVRRRLVGAKPPPTELEDISFETWLRRRYVGRPWSRLFGGSLKRPPDWAEGADVTIRQERLQDDIDALMRRLGVQEHVEVPVINPSRVRRERPYQEFYTPAARRIVEQIFADRLTRYGYRFEEQPSES